MEKHPTMDAGGETTERSLQKQNTWSPGLTSAAEGAPPVVVMEKHDAGGGKTTARILQKQNTWSPDIERNEAWERRRRSLMRRKQDSSSPLQGQGIITNEDLEDLRGSLDLGFGFEPPPGCAACSEDRSKMLETLPALDLYYAVKEGGGRPEGCTCSGGSSEPSPVGSPLSILSLDDPPETVKTKLKQWAKVVAMSVHYRP